MDRDGELEQDTADGYFFFRSVRSHMNKSVSKKQDKTWDD